MGKLNGKVAIITGAARGMGETMARLFASEGARVVLADVDSAGAAVAADIGPAALFCTHDVAKEDDWTRTISETEDTFGPVGILVNNAGVYSAEPLEETRASEFDRLVAVNQRGVLLGMRAALPSMRHGGGGAIVNISSTAGLIGVPRSLVYASTKWAVRGMTLSAVAECAAIGVRVNVVYPGVIGGTPMTAANDPDYIARLARRVPLGRVGSPLDVARAALFLASDDASYVTGAQLVVDGGASA